MRGRENGSNRVALVLALAWCAGVAMVLPAGAGDGSLCQVGPGLFDYGPHRDDPEAEQLAMTLTGELRAPDDEYERIRRDLALIRQAYPVLTSVVDDPDYVRDEMIVGLDGGQPWDGYQALNQFYQVIQEDHLFGDTYVLTFCDTINASVLGALYDDLGEVSYAEPNGYIGNDDRITIAVNGTTYRYTIEDGFLDCFDGCDCERLWLVDVTEGGNVGLVLYNESGASYCQFDDSACCRNGNCTVRPIGNCLNLSGTPLDFETSCDGDPDADGLDAACGDNCPDAPNPTQEDFDADGAGDVCDNCPETPNPEQGDLDVDLVGDVCDNCPAASNPEQDDLDRDTFGDPCDNCVSFPNRSQADLDHDLEGDACDLDDGLIYVFCESPPSMQWQDEAGFDAWNSYKGDLEVLVAEGIYTQLPGSNPLAAATCGLLVTSVGDPVPPESGRAAFFLTTGVAAGRESDLGEDSEGGLRANDHPCP